MEIDNTNHEYINKISDGPKALVKLVDMSEDMQQIAADLCYEAMENLSNEKDVAAFLKKEFDCKYGSNWQCIVGKSFGSYITHEENKFIFFSLKDYSVVLFKSG